jgi:hypothetical protein
MIKMEVGPVMRVFRNSSNHFYDASEATKMYEAIEEMSESEPCDEVAKRPVVVKTWFI